MSESMVDRLAKIVSPEWFTVHDGVCGLDNYPDQHKRYQELARARARQIIAAMREPSEAMLAADVPRPDALIAERTAQGCDDYAARMDAAVAADRLHLCDSDGSGWWTQHSMSDPMCNSPYMTFIRFSQGLPDGYEVVWASDAEMYYWRGKVGDYQGPFADRFRARREAIAHSRSTQ